MKADDSILSLIRYYLRSKSHPNVYSNLLSNNDDVSEEIKVQLEFWKACSTGKCE